MTPCQDPELIVDPRTATDEDVNAERLRVAKAYTDCKKKHGDLAGYYRRLKGE